MATKSNDKVSISGKRPKSGGGSRKGIPNKTTQTAREAFAKLVEGNAPKMQRWLDKVADGIPVMVKEIVNDEEVKVQALRQDGSPVWVVPPAPEKALDIIQKIAEYHIPKLARTELVGDADQPVEVVYRWED